MPEVKAPDFVTRLQQALKDSLAQVGIDAEVSIDPVPGTKLYRIIVVASGFEPMGHSERQGLVWRVADRVLSKDEQLFISAIYTLTEDGD